ncbi:acyltransferase [Acetobacter sp. LMG 32666]|uniref:acyltransferase family protein n=1 Tax=Acetobacter sp. LMG 32666 TaxID=2959295 RepID=UPI0030C8BF6E
MFGIYRLILALMVELSHTGHYGPIGHLAIIGFFVLSGFLMTLLMHTTYRGHIGDFALNRFLRLYPTYWVCMIISALLYIWTPSKSIYYGFPTIPHLILNILYLNYNLNFPSLLEVSWAVTNEIIMYVLIALGISKTLGRTALWLLISFVYYESVSEFAPGNEWSYFMPTAASFPFAIGAMVYHLYNYIPQQFYKKYLLFSFAGCVASIYIICSLHFNSSANAIFLCSSAVFVMGLFQIRPSATLKKWDNKLGSLSYPLYLIHLPIASVIFNKIHHSGPKAIDLVIMILSLLMSWGIVAVVDKPVNRLRDMIRRQAQTPPKLNT